MMIRLNFNGLKLEMISTYQNVVTVLGKEETAIDSDLVPSTSCDADIKRGCEVSMAKDKIGAAEAVGSAQWDK